MYAANYLKMGLVSVNNVACETCRRFANEIRNGRGDGQSLSRLIQGERISLSLYRLYFVLSSYLETFADAKVEFDCKVSRPRVRAY